MCTPLRIHIVFSSRRIPMETCLRERSQRHYGVLFVNMFSRPNIKRQTEPQASDILATRTRKYQHASPPNTTPASPPNTTPDCNLCNGKILYRCGTSTQIWKGSTDTLGVHTDTDASSSRASRVLEHRLQTLDDVIMNKVFKRSGQGGKVVQSKLPEQASGWSHQTEVSSERHVSRFTASNLEKHDWQAPMLSDPYFPHTDSRVDAQSSVTPERGQDASGKTDNWKATCSFNTAAV